MRPLCISCAASLLLAAFAGGQAAFTLDRAVYGTDDTLVASWTNGPGSATDWVGIYPRGVVPDGDPSSTDWLYVNGTRTSTVPVVNGSVPFSTSGLGVGEWSAHFLANNGYAPITAAVDFEVSDVVDTAIVSFSADRQFIDDGLPIVLSWNVVEGSTPITSLTLDDGTGPVGVLGQASLGVSPSANTVYTLLLNGSISAKAGVFKDAGNTMAFFLDELVYPSGGHTTVSWAGVAATPEGRVGVFRVGETPGSDPPVESGYLNGVGASGASAPSGSMGFDLADGNYFVCLFVDAGDTIGEGPIRFRVGDGGPPPVFVTDPIRRVYAVVGQAYSGKVGAYARLADGGSVTWSKGGGPSWLSVAGDGALSGVPGLSDVGGNRFDLRAESATGAGATAELSIEVFAPGTVHVPVLKVLSFNIWGGAGRVSDGYYKGMDSIILSDADVVAISENGGRASQWAAELGWHSYSDGGSNAVLSRYPLAANFSASVSVGATVRVADAPLRDVNFWGCHLSPYPYGPYEARDASGGDASRLAAALQAEADSGRVSQINGIVGAMSTQLAASDAVPVLLLGDFNCPSHLDWTPSTAAAGMHFGLVVDWPVTRAVETAGMVDAYRVVHPDPVATPGDTWTPIHPNDVQDRIDMVHFRGAGVSVTGCQVFTTIPQGRWPSDHAGVLAQFRIAPVDLDADLLADAWENMHFGDTASQGTSGDIDHDGYDHFAEQAFGLDPNSTEDVAAAQVTATASGDGIVIHHRRLGGGLAEAGVYAVDGVRYIIESSKDLLVWGPAGAVPEGEPVSLGGGIERVAYRVAIAQGSRCFLRVRAVSVP